MRFVTDEVAAIAEALGFWTYGHGTSRYKRIGDRTCSTPTQVELQDWLREHYEVNALVTGPGLVSLYTEGWTWRVTMHLDPTLSYEALLEQALELGLRFTGIREVRENEAHRSGE